MPTFRKSERLCNFNLKKILFEKGKSFFIYPFKVHWLIISDPVEQYFVKQKHLIYSSESIDKPEVVKRQNPSYPFIIIPGNALFYYPVKCLTGVSSKRIKNATDRNYIKRLIKESYRKNKNDIYPLLMEKNKYCLLAFVYCGKTNPDYKEIEEKIILSLQQLKNEIVSL